MNIYEFKELSVEEQVNRVWGGTFIGNRTIKGFSVVLYSISNFFVEVFYSQHENAISKLKVFQSSRLLKPYLKTIDISELL